MSAPLAELVAVAEVARAAAMCATRRRCALIEPVGCVLCVLVTRFVCACLLISL